MYFMKRMWKIFILLVLSASLLVSCGTSSEDKADVNPPQKDKVVIGFAMDTLVHERWLRDRDIFVAKAKDLGAEVILQIAYSDGEEQEKRSSVSIGSGN